MSAQIAAEPARALRADHSGAASASSAVHYPFTAIVGQEEMKLCLLLNVIDPRIGGVMIMGHRGTGKSTAVRALADVLPMITRVKGDPFNRTPEEVARDALPIESAAERNGASPTPRQPRDSRLRTERIPVPVVDLPLGATEDRVCGTIDIEAALTQGVKRFEPGLLARANHGFLYIDEVNLLDDHLVDVLLDVAASGWNVVEREGISVRHPARFVLVGSGNPEEGELRPQLLDRFGLHARIVTITDVAQRMEIVRRRRAFDADPRAFIAAWQPQQRALRRRIVAAQKRLAEVEMPDDALMVAAELCMRLGVDGHRGELTLARAACALAAFEGRPRVTRDDVKRVAVPALRHRLRRDPLETTDAGERIERALMELQAQA
ncbi:MAG: magnesium chelatase ATPase subunit I [Chloroflexi bacterium]|jgi:magnesium chelatase subunit I|uniref:Mg-protoporphyrin IX chelatase n=1 Tax=Candidatus Thermofonsia Clade 3 bacterium TaxID=2364212 RepID=A0A2M8QAH8_9CHLR|nr:magnesium chelatase ATPase subunit I [Candidatus Roseilinea sp. NK_OTU-006]PJF46816.1 MAG: magnesium chelatase ATPase subunit I [Candidatus Thermofonsia Clade 3 bacterium]RMG63236.1 MAG: magnesium chelatase ATPase subunit I [Chloroflexota bacterium]